MSKKLFKINYGSLQPMDIVLTGRRSLFGGFVRVVTGGLSKLTKRDVAVHCGLVVDLDGELVMAEMTGKDINGRGGGLLLSSLESYNTSRDFIVGIKRHGVYANRLVRQAAMRRIFSDVRHTLDYDFKGIVGFVFDRVKENPKKYYCSEYVYMQTAVDGVAYPDGFAERVSPYDLQKFNSGFCEVQFKFNKEES